MTDETCAREPSAPEVALIRRLLSVEFPGCSTLRDASKKFLVKTLDKNGSIQIIPESIRKAVVEKQVVVEGEAEDGDGVKVHVLLHVRDGLLRELEIYKEDGSNLSSSDVLKDIDVFSLPPYPHK